MIYSHSVIVVSVTNPKRLSYLWNSPGLSGPVELRVEVGRPEVVLLAGGLLVPGAAPVLVGGRVRLGVLEEVTPVHPGTVQHRRHTHRLGLVHLQDIDVDSEFPHF